MKECRIIIINEESGELLKNELIDEELADQIAGIVEDGFIENYEGCEEICSTVAKMIEDVGISTENHEEMIDAMKDLRFIIKPLSENKGKIIRNQAKKDIIKQAKKKKIIRKKKIECECD